MCWEEAIAKLFCKPTPLGTNHRRRAGRHMVVMYGVAPNHAAQKGVSLLASGACLCGENVPAEEPLMVALWHVGRRSRRDAQTQPVQTKTKQPDQQGRAARPGGSCREGQPPTCP